MQQKILFKRFKTTLLTFFALPCATLACVRGYNQNSVTAQTNTKCKPIEFLVGDYNVENLWDKNPKNTEKPYEAFSQDKSNWYSANMAFVKATQTAHAIELAGAPDVLALQEIESAENQSLALELLIDALKKRGIKYDHIALGKQNPKNPTNVTTAVLSKYPILKNENLDFEFHPRETPMLEDKAARDPQAVDIDIDGTPFRIYTSHWKSKRGDAHVGDEMRSKVARIIKEDVDKKQKQNNQLTMVVTGDFNLNYDEPPMTKILKSTDRQDLQDGLYNLWYTLHESDRCSYAHEGKRYCIDNILVSSAGLPKFNGQIKFVQNSFHVVGHNDKATEFLMQNNEPYRWQQRHGKKGRIIHTGFGYSDHLPLVAKFQKNCPE